MFAPEASAEVLLRLDDPTAAEPYVAQLREIGWGDAELWRLLEERGLASEMVAPPVVDPSASFGALPGRSFGRSAWDGVCWDRP